MDLRVLMFVVIVSSCWCAYARDLNGNQFAGESALILDMRSLEDIQYMEEFRKNEDLCTLCEKFTSDAIQYLAENKTQTEIISILHQTCTKIHRFEKQCMVFVDVYAPLLLSEVSSMNPKDLCQKEALEKLKDPDTELEIVKLLMKACGSTGKNVKKCKRLVIEYTPIILVNAQQLLETKDLCTIFHACSLAPVVYTSK